ncbi:unnamed protein product, partial [Closterium sp. NIES-65]
PRICHIQNPSYPESDISRITNAEYPEAWRSWSQDAAAAGAGRGGQKKESAAVEMRGKEGRVALEGKGAYSPDHYLCVLLARTSSTAAPRRTPSDAARLESLAAHDGNAVIPSLTLTAGGHGAAAPRAAVRHEAVGRAGEERSAQEEQQVMLKFTQQFRESFLRNHLGGAAFLQDVSLDGNSLPFFCQDFQQQQQEGAGSAALAFGGLSYEECTAVFFAPNARCYRQPASLNLSSVTSSPPHSQAASVCATAAASIADFPVSHEASPVAAASNFAARRRALKRPRGDSPTLGAQPALLGGRESWFVPRGFVQGGVLRGGVVCGTEHGHQPVAEQFQQQGASSLMQQAADEALLEALLQEEHRQQQQGGARSRAQRMLWPRVGSESALPDDVLLGCNSDDPAFIQRSALSAPLPTQPHAALPAPMRPQLAALPASAPCIGDFAEQPVEWLRVGLEG